MIDHLSLPVSDYARSRAFYDKALGALGCKVVMEITDAPDFIGAGYGAARRARARRCGSVRPGCRWRHRSRPRASTSPSGRRSRAAVDAFYREALATGGTDNGAPGLRPHYHPSYYAAFVLDPDGHRIEAVCHLPG